MQLISLFSGIGGFEVASEAMVWDNIVSCEINEFCQKVLKYYWPNAYHHSDVKTLTYEIIKEKSRIDRTNPIILVGGFPCQPYSSAGKRLGKEDERHLWPEMLRLIREIAPDWIVGENVRGLTNWNGGLVFDEVQADLEASGYSVLPFLLPAGSVNAPHRRDRIWFIAHANQTGAGMEEYRSCGQKRSITENMESKVVRQKFGKTSSEGIAEFSEFKDASNADRQGLPESGQTGVGEFSAETSQGLDHRPEFVGDAGNADRQQPSTNGTICQGSDTNARGNSRPDFGQPRNWNRFPTQSPVCSGNDGIPTELSGIAVSKHRIESIKAYGNAIVPQVVLQIFKAIEAYYEQSE